MKTKIRYRLLALFMTLALVFPDVGSIMSYAASTSVSTGATGNASGIPGGAYNSILWSPVIQIRIDSIPNNTSESDRDKIIAHNVANPDNLWNECMVSAIDQQLYELPEHFLKEAIIEDTALIKCYDNHQFPMTIVDNNENIVNPKDGDNTFKYSWNAEQVGIQTSSGWSPNITKDKIMANSTVYEQFKSGQLTVDEIGSANCWYEGDNKRAGLELIGMFAEGQSQYAAEKINSIFRATGPDAYYENMLYYLDFLLAVWYVQGYNDSTKGYINDFLRTLNSDGSNEFIIVNMVASSQGPELPMYPGYFPLFTLPVWYSFNSPESPEKYRQVVAGGLAPVSAVDQVDGSRPSYSADPSGWTADMYNQYMNIAKFFGTEEAQRYTGANGDIQWWTTAQTGTSNGKRAALLLLPTDMYGKETGGIGYTYFTTGPAGPSTTNLSPSSTYDGPPMGMILTASTTTPNVPDDATYVSTDLNLAIKQDSSEQLYMRTTFTERALTGVGDAKLTLDFSLDTLQGGIDTNNVIDGVVTPAESSVESGARVVWEDVSWDDIKPFITGTGNIILADRWIRIPENSTVRYKVVAKLEWNDGLTIPFTAKGDIVVSEYVAADDVTWVLQDDAEDRVHYQNTPEQPRIEVKEGTPGNESFEAMAGVPTTEDLYVAFGSTEFLVDMEAQEDVSPVSERVYELHYTFLQCGGYNESCIYSCPGSHSVTANSHSIVVGTDPETGADIMGTCDGETVTGSCASGPITLEASCGCGQNTASKTFTPVYGSGYTECLAKDGTGAVYTGMGCVHTQKTNKCHTYDQTYVGTVKQPIGAFNYLNITDLDLWQLDELEFLGNDDLWKYPNFTIDPNLGYAAFYTQDEYKTDNGRLEFSYQLQTTPNEWGNTDIKLDDNQIILKDDADVFATEWMNTLLEGKTVSATTYSDYLTLATTEGYQAIANHQYQSDTVLVTSNDFSIGGNESSYNGGPSGLSDHTTKEIAGDMITFPEHTWDDFWVTNKETARELGDDGIVYSGYNGKYDEPSNKFVNHNYINGKQWTFDLDTQPNREVDEMYGSFKSDASNLRLTEPGMDVIDSTDEVTKDWSASDGIEPVSNGEWITGRGYIHMPRVIQFESPSGIDYGNEYSEEASYAEGKTSANNIIIHNPVSTQEAIMLSNDDMYDLRTDESLLDGGDPRVVIDGCPLDSTCDHQILTCTEPFVPHSDGCTEELNTHVHTSNCVTLEPIDFAYTGKEVAWTAPQDMTIDLQAWGASGGGTGGGKGGYSEGTITVKKGDVLYFNVGGQGTAAPSNGFGGGGFNGGGNGAGSGTNVGFGGGGMSSITSSALSSASALSSIKDSIVMIAGGGGGMDNEGVSTSSPPNDNGLGGYGGGLIGGNAYIDGYLASATVSKATTESKTISENQSTTWSTTAVNAGNVTGSYSGCDVPVLTISVTYGGKTYSDSSNDGGEVAYVYVPANTAYTATISLTSCGNHTNTATVSYPTGVSYPKGEYGGTQSSGNMMGQGGSATVITDTGGAGGGYWGGKVTNHNNGGAGGGSAYIGGVLDGKTIAGNSKMLDKDGNYVTGSTGNGHIRITPQYYCEATMKVVSTQNYAYTGKQETYTATEDVTLKLQAWGAAGGGVQGGKGGYSEGEISLKKGETIYINVGGKGTESPAGGFGGGGFNGGGNGSSHSSSTGARGFGGGGMTSVTSASLNSASLLSTIKNDILLIAGGGGGSDDDVFDLSSDYNEGAGGYGGGLTAGNAKVDGVDTGTNISATTSVLSYTSPTSYTKMLAPGTYKIEAYGASGGYGTQNGGVGAAGGYGGYTYGTYTLSEATTMSIVIGGKGSDAVAYSYATGGYNGGGKGTKDSSDDDSAGGGGGATHIATYGGLLSSLSGKESSILLVAGAGAGGSMSAGTSGNTTGTTNGVLGKGDDGTTVITNDPWTGNAGGGSGYRGGIAGGYATGGYGYVSSSLSSSAIISGDTSKYVGNGKVVITLLGYPSGYGSGGTQSSGYMMGQGEHSTLVDDSGGAGGGYWGGKATHHNNGGAGGGSSYIGGVKNGATIAGNSVMPGFSSGTMTGNSSNGYLKISVIEYDSGINAHTCTSACEGSCYETIEMTIAQCTGILNAHKHTAECYEQSIYNYGYTGAVQTWTSPITGTIKLETWGAQGGTGGDSNNMAGGYGGYSQGKLEVTKGEVLSIYVGGQGSGTSGGYNGGGDSKAYGGGGGATSIVKNAIVQAETALHNYCNSSRVEKTSTGLKFDSSSDCYWGPRVTASSGEIWKVDYTGTNLNYANFDTYAYTSNSNWTSTLLDNCTLLYAKKTSTHVQLFYRVNTTSRTAGQEFRVFGNGSTPITLTSVTSVCMTKGNTLIVGAGGGGGAHTGIGGIGGGTTGGNGASSSGSYGQGGTQTAAGYNGGFGYGGIDMRHGGGGGAGYYGGGGGGNDCEDGGGGGSSYVGGVYESSTTSGNRAGNGYAKITVIDTCTGELNAHICDTHCLTTLEQKVLDCDNPHHYVLGQPYDPLSPSMHYLYGDPRCWTPCGNDDNHRSNNEVTLGNGQLASFNDVFINLDREFQIYYPNIGDFEQEPHLHGILDTTYVRGMGYEDNMNVDKWTRTRTVTFGVHVIDELGVLHGAGEEINLDLLPEVDDMFTFYCVLANSETMNSSVIFNAIASNAKEVDMYSENDKITNRERNTYTKAARHTAEKKQYFDVVGSIGALAIHDTEDLRFANFFKASDPSKGWIVDNVIPQVNFGVQKTLIGGQTTVRNDLADASTHYLSTYGALEDVKGKPYVQLPLTPYINTTTQFKDQFLKPGYNVFLDVETQGNYYGENRNPDTNEHQDSNIYYKTQVTPRYWALEVDTGIYTPVDVYMSQGDDYAMVNSFDTHEGITEHYLYLDWSSEYARRNFTDEEEDITNDVKDNLGVSDPETRIPSAFRDVIGTSDQLFLNDQNRTYIGTSETYGVDKNPGDRVLEQNYEQQSQRWHFTIGLPSSSVFIERNTPCTSDTIPLLTDDKHVIVCSLDIKSKGNVWTLEYNGNGLFNPEPFRIDSSGKIYYPPTDPVTGSPLEDPIIAVFDADETAKDDLVSSGTH